VNVGVAVLAFSRTALLEAGRSVNVHAYDSGVPSGSLDPDPSSCTVAFSAMLL